MTASTASSGRVADLRSRRSRTRSASRCATSTTCPPSTTTTRSATSPPTTTSARGSPPSCGWSRTTGRSASSRRPATSPRSASSDSVARVGPRARVRRALDRGHLLPPGPRHGQRHRLRLDRRRRQARHDAALDRQHRPDHARRAGAARHGRRGPQPLHRRRDPHPARLRHLHAAAARALRPRVRGAGGRHPGGPPRRAVPRRPRRRDGGARPRAGATWACCRSRPRRRSTRTPRSTPAGPSTAPATCSAWTSTTAAAPPASLPQGTSPRAWSSPSSPVCTSRRTTCSSPRSCAASASGSRTTSSSPPTAPEPLRLAPPHLDRRRGVDGPAALGRRLAPAWTATTTTRSAAAPAPCSARPRARQLSDKEAHARSLVDSPGVAADRRRRGRAASATRPRWRSAAPSDAPTLGILDRDLSGIDLRDCGLHSDGLRGGPRPHRRRGSATPGLAPYDVATRRGELKHVLLTESPDGELMLRLVLRSTALEARIRSRLPALLEAVPALRGGDDQRAARRTRRCSRASARSC